jgi:diguanylate cyclase (GGDEF)-like protein
VTATSSQGPTESALVPLADRLRHMQTFRFVAAATVVIVWIALPSRRELSFFSLAGVTAAFLAMSVLSLRSVRFARERALRVFGFTLLADGLYLAFASYATAGFGHPLQYLVLLHLVAVTLLASFRTGVKTAVWHTLLATSTVQLHHDGLLATGHPSTLGTGVDVGLFLVVVWMGTLLTASFAAVNERELRRRNYDLQALARLSWRLESALQPQEVGQALVDAVAQDFDVSRLVLLVRQNGGLVPLAAKGLHDVPHLAPEADRLLAQSLTERRTLRLADPRADEHPWLSHALPNPGNVVTLPMYAEGTPVGILVLENGDARGARIERRAIEMLERFVSQASLALTNAALLAQVRALAAADGLTGVANRRTFDAALSTEVSRAARSGRPLTLVLFDVDHFKHHNDTYGHQAGDEALRAVAAALRASVRPVDMVARYGGEEFGVLLPDTDLLAGAEAAERMRAAVEGMTGGPRVTASLGVAAYPLNAGDPTTLVAAADAALYEAKQQGRNRVVATRRAAPLAGSPDDAGVTVHEQVA